MVGDKFMLTGECVRCFTEEWQRARWPLKGKKKSGSLTRGDHVLIDTYNVLFTVNNYLLGKLCSYAMMACCAMPEK